jgi:hypothetical protein
MGRPVDPIRPGWVDPARMGPIRTRCARSGPDGPDLARMGPIRPGLGPIRLGWVRIGPGWVGRSGRASAPVCLLPGGCSHQLLPPNANAGPARPASRRRLAAFASQRRGSPQVCAPQRALARRGVRLRRALRARASPAAGLTPGRGAEFNPRSPPHPIPAPRMARPPCLRARLGATRTLQARAQTAATEARGPGPARKLSGRARHGRSRVRERAGSGRKVRLCSESACAGCAPPGPQPPVRARGRTAATRTQVTRTRVTARDSDSSRVAGGCRAQRRRRALASEPEPDP